MLSIGKLGKGQERYYLDKVAEGAEDYYSGEGEEEGVWLGDAALDLGLQGTVEADQLTAMLTGRNPATGEPLGLRAVGGGGAVPGFDLTFSIPKSASLLWALGGTEASHAVTESVDRSLNAALGYLQREACWTRRGAGAEFVKGSGFLVAAFGHRSSRAGDPQVHVHALIANATQGPDGKWTRLYHPAVYEHAKTAGYLFEAHFRHELSQRLGVRWGEVRNGIAEIEGFPDLHLREFSTRRKEILEAAGSDASARARQVATLATRTAKEKGATREGMRERWARQAEEIGLTPEVLAATIGREAVPAITPTFEHFGREVTAHASHFDRRDAIQAVAQLLPGGGPAPEVEAIADAFLASEVVMSIGREPRGERFTTVRVWEIERRALAVAEEMIGAEDRAVAGELLLCRALDASPGLKADQRAMVARLLTGGEGLVVVIGEAGTGKTYATLAAAHGWAAAGIELRVAAPTWRAANVLRSEGLEATSVARLLAQLDHAATQGRPLLPNNSVLLVDEAGMVDSASLARLIDHAEAAEAKLVLIGDPAQLGEIEAGGLFRALAEQAAPVLLDEVIRHRHDLDREAAKRIREGQGAEALSLYRSEQRVVIAPDPHARREAMVADWWQSFAKGEDALMVAKRNAEVAKLNALARELLAERGRLGKVEITVGKGRFAVGDQVITRVNDHCAEIYNRERWRVAEVDAKRGSLLLDGIDTPRRVCVDAVYLGRTTEHGDPAIQHAYAATTYQAQGSTVDRAYVMADPSMDRQELYVAASRSREETWLYATPEVQLAREEIAPADPHLRKGLQHIAEAAERDRAQVAAHDQALRSELGSLPDPDLYARRRQLADEAREESRHQERLERLREQVAENLERLAQVWAERGRLDSLPRQERRAELAMIETREAMNEEAGVRLREELRSLAPEPEHRARAELAVVEHLIAERERAAFVAAQLSPPPHITKELGERPQDPKLRGHWDEAVREIEGYRREHGISDRESALGPRSKDPAAELKRQRAQRAVERAQRRLNLEQRRSRAAERSLDMGIGL
jgi:conjugative relaxase-like TrwC/TraI family protein